MPTSGRRFQEQMIFEGHVCRCAATLAEKAYLGNLLCEVQKACERDSRDCLENYVDSRQKGTRMGDL